MKTNLLKSTLALCALCAVLNLKAENNPGSTRTFIGEIPLDQVTAVTPVNGDTVTPGTSRIMVSMRLGSPSAVLPDGTWLYTGFATDQGDNNPNRSGTLVVRFTAHKVSRLSLADKGTVLALRSAPRPPANDRLLAANQRR